MAVAPPKTGLRGAHSPHGTGCVRTRNESRGSGGGHSGGAALAPPDLNQSNLIGVPNCRPKNTRFWSIPLATPVATTVEVVSERCWKNRYPATAASQGLT